MSEITFADPAAEDRASISGLKVCPECGRMPKHFTAGKCDTCYKRERRREGTRRWPLPDPGITVGLFQVPGTNDTFARRVFAHVDAAGDCWEWRGAKTNGYGVINRGGGGDAGNEQAHRAVWQMLVGEIKDDLQLDHLCRNRGCVNPDHLEPVTAEENKRRGFSSAALYGRRKTCEFSHPLDGIRRRGDYTYRYCITCDRVQQRRRYHERKKQAA